MPRHTTLPIATLDFETDPFSYGGPSTPFAWGFYDGVNYTYHWGADWKEALKRHLESIEPHMIFAHNGGKFDWMFITDWFEGAAKIIHYRVAEVYALGHTLRDSFCNMPVPLRDIVSRDHKKKDIDIDKLKRNVRHKHKTEILAYMREDCVLLFDAISQWTNMFGQRTLTMAKAALNALNDSFTEEEKEGHRTIWQRMTDARDAEIRPFYYGGRVQCMQPPSVLEDSWQVHDVKSMYPAVMRNMEHPISAEWKFSKNIDDRTDFAVIQGVSDGILPWIDDKHKLRFDAHSGTFNATGHEIRMGLELGRLQIDKVIEAYTFTKRVKFDKFIDRFFKLRQDADSIGDEMLTLFYKLVMNSAYGKFGMNPRKYMDYYYYDGDDFVEDLLDPDGWRKFAENQLGQFTVYARPSANREQNFINVAAAASITGGARAMLAKGLHYASRPIYCDTDAIFCRSMPKEMVFQGHKSLCPLGSWLLEKEANIAAIAGKKLYALFSPTIAEANVVKKASKGIGAKLQGEIIAKIASGEIDIYNAVIDSPHFNLAGKPTWGMKRDIRATA